MSIAKQAARDPTTIPWIWTKARLLRDISQASSAPSMWPRFAAVESLDAKVISRFPLSPSKAGTRMKSSGHARKTSQCWTWSRSSPAITIPVGKQMNQ